MSVHWARATMKRLRPMVWRLIRMPMICSSGRSRPARHGGGSIGIVVLLVIVVLIALVVLRLRGV